MLLKSQPDRERQSSSEYASASVHLLLLFLYKDGEGTSLLKKWRGGMHCALLGKWRSNVIFHLLEHNCHFLRSPRLRYRKGRQFGVYQNTREYAQHKESLSRSSDRCYPLRVNNVSSHTNSKYVHISTQTDRFLSGTLYLFLSHTYSYNDTHVQRRTQTYTRTHTHSANTLRNLFLSYSCTFITV